MIPDLISQLSNGDTLNRIAAQLGTDETTAQNAIGAAVPMLFGGLARNAATDDGANALHSTLDRHDGSVLDDVDGYLDAPRTDDGEKIVGHVFGEKQEIVASQLAGIPGLDRFKTGQLLATLAPLVMGFLAKQKHAQGLNSDGLSGYLSQQVGGQGGSGLIETITNMMDRNHDGSFVDDVSGMLGSFFGKK